MIGFALAAATCLALFFAAVWLSSGTLSHGAAAWAATILDERLDMLEASERPATVIVSGSNGLFGLSASQLERALGVRVVNISSHAGVRWKFIDWTVLGRLRPGDTVILPLEVNHFSSNPDAIQTLTTEVAHTLGLGFFWSLPLIQKGEYLELLSWSFLRRQVGSDIGRAFRRPKGGYWSLATLPGGDLDTAGAKRDHTNVRKEANANVRKEGNGKFRVENIAENGTAICDTIQRLRARDVAVIGTGPNIYIKREALNSYEAFLDELGKFYRNCGAEFVLDKSQGIMRLEDMLDTRYHPNAEGRKRRTANLVQALCDQIYECPMPTPKSGHD
jgi:hypothetical protein